MRKTVPTVALAALLGLGGGTFASALAQDGPGQAEVGKAASPRACVEAMIACAKKGDLEALATYLAEPSRSIVGAMLKLGAADRKLAQALDARFGAGSSASLPNARGPLFLDGDVAIVDVSEQDAAATVKVSATPPGGDEDAPAFDLTVTCARIDGSWLAQLPRPDRRGGPGGPPGGGPGPGRDPGAGGPGGRGGPNGFDPGAGLAKVAAGVEALADDVTAGKVASKEDALARRAAVERDAFPRRGPGGPGGFGGPPDGPPPGDF